ncbi:MAG: thioredoxin domain-containing protein [Cyclobacteriaceae bacterium]
MINTFPNFFKGLAVLLLSFAFEACGQASTTALKPVEFASQIQQGNIQLLDVRTATEFQRFRLNDALHADWYRQAEFKERTKYLETDKPVYVYCLTGVRSAKAAQALAAKGFKVYEMDGGLNFWRRAGLPVEEIETEQQISLEDYKNLLPEKGYVLVDFGAKWCPPCKVMDPKIEALAQKNKDLFYLVKIDGGIQTDILKKLNVQSFPTLIVYKDGVEVWRKEGLSSDEEILAQMKNP